MDIVVVKYYAEIKQGDNIDHGHYQIIHYFI